MTPKSVLANVLLWGVAFGCVGAAVGATLGTVAPGYYRSVVPGGQSPDFSPIQAGIGIGAWQGFAVGSALSLFVLALLTGRDVLCARGASEAAAATYTSRIRTWSVHVLWGLAAVTSVIIVGAAALLIGGISGQQELYQSWTDRKLEKLATIMHTSEFPNIHAEYSSAAQVSLRGEVHDESAHDALRYKLVLMFGTDEAENMIRLVGVAR